MTSFIFGEGTDTPSYEELQRRRAIVDRLLALEDPLPRSFGEGLTLVGRAIGERRRDRRLSAQEDQARTRGRGQFSEIMAALNGGQAAPSPGGAAPAAGAPAPATDAQPWNWGGGLPPSLIQSESSGSFTAQNDVPGAGGTGHFGRGQFSRARLADAARAGVIPEGTTPEQFLVSPEMQQRVEQWHVADIGRQIESSGLGRFVGQQINGVPVTPQGMLAVAHLGGFNGLRRFLETGGEYNPSDAYGTSLLSYLGRHAGGAAQPGRPAQPAPAPGGAPFAPTPVNVAEMATERGGIDTGVPVLLGLSGQPGAQTAMIRMPDGQVQRAPAVAGPGGVQIEGMGMAAGVGQPVQMAGGLPQPEAARMPTAPMPAMPQESPVPAPQADPAVPPMPGMAAGPNISPQMLAQLGDVMSNPYVPEGQRRIAEALVRQQMEGMDPMRQMEMERARLQLEQMRNPAPAGPISLSPGTTLFDPNSREPIFTAPNRDATPPAGVQEYEFYARQEQEAGRQPRSFAEWDEARRRASGTNVNVGSDGTIGTIPQGYMLVGEGADRRMVPIPGGPADTSGSDAARQANRARAGATVVQDLQRALDLLPELGALTGQGGVVGGVSRGLQARVPGSVVNRITQFTESALSNVGLDTLQAMREASPTGGALGQVPIQQQRRLEQVLGSLEVTQPPDVLQANIRRVINIYNDIIYGTPEERAAAVSAGRLTPEQSAEIDSYYYALPFDQQGRPSQDRPPAGRSEGQAQGDNTPPAAPAAASISEMGMRELIEVDPSSLNPDDLRAYVERMRQINGR